MSNIADLIDRNSSDPRERLELGQQLVAQLQISRLLNDSKLLNDFCDLVMQWLSGSNFKVALLALEILDVAIEISGDVLSPFLLERINSLIERLGDSKQNVRDATVQLITTMAGTPHCSPQIILEKVSQGLTHRQWLVRIGVMQVIRCMLVQNKEEVEVQVNRLIPTLCKLMGDPNSDVREASANTLVNIFWQLGEHVPVNVQKRRLIPETKFQMLMARYHSTQQNGNPNSLSTTMSQRVPRPLRRPQIPQKPSFNIYSGRVMNDSRRGPVEEQENAAIVPPWQRASSVPAHKRPIAVTARNKGTAGAVNTEAFQKAFVEVPKCEILSERQLKDKLSTTIATLENMNVDWDRRVTALKTLRSIIICGGLDFSNFTEELKEMQQAMLNSVKDLRSQVCREACVTIAFYCERLDLRMVNLLDGLMPSLICLLQNSAKVMATSAQVALQYAVKYVPSAKLFSHLQTAMSSKSREIRRNVASLMMMALSLWDSRIIERNMTAFLDAIKMSLNDPDPETRSTGRDMFVQLDQDYKQHADMLYKTLDIAKQRALSGYISQSSSSQSIISEKDSLPVSQRSAAYGIHKASPSYYAGRSTSDIDPNAARRATNRTRCPPKLGPPLQLVNGNATSAQLRTLAAQRLMSTPQKSPMFTTPKRVAAPPSTNFVRSQPGSRSTSPASRLQQTRLPPRMTPNRVRSQTEDLEDHISASSDSFRFETEDLASVLSSCTASSLGEKKLALSKLSSIIANERNISPIDLKKIVERLNLLINDGTYNLLQPLSEVLIAFVRIHHAELGDWLNHLIPKLITKHCNDLVLSNNRDKYRSMLDAVRMNFDPEKQLHAVCKFIQDPIRNNVPFKIKRGLLIYLHELMQSMDVAPSMNQSEVRQAVTKIFQWVNDPKNVDLLSIAEKIVCDMFHLNASDFASMIATFPNDLKDRLQAIVRQSCVKASANGDFGLSAGDPRAGILETTAQINDFVDRRNIMSSPIRSPLHHSTQRLMSENGSFRRASGEDISGRHSGYLLDPQGFLMDFEHQEELISKIGEDLSHHNEMNQERLRSMSILSQITRENLFQLWETHFKVIFLLLIETLKDEDADVRRMALKLLKEICYSQAQRVNHFAEMALIRVLDACEDESKAVSDVKVLTAAEECGNVLATHVSAATCRRVLLAVIKSNVGEHKMNIAIKMLIKVIESLGAGELETILDDVVPPILNAYNGESSTIRKSSVVCLATMIIIVGEGVLAPYLSSLAKGKQKLIEVYVSRMRGTSSTSTHGGA